MKHAYRSTVFGLLLLGVAALLAACNFNFSTSGNSGAAPAAQAPASKAVQSLAAAPAAGPPDWLDQTVSACRQPLLDTKEFRHCGGQQKIAALLAGGLQTMSRDPVECNATDGCTLKVLVKEDKDNNCTAELPYGRLVVKGSQVGGTVTWKLDAPHKDYKFASPGIQPLPTDPPVHKDPTQWWSTQSSGNLSVTLQIKQVASAGTAKAEFCHYPRVVNRHRSDGQLCCPIDPIIINDP